MSNEMIERVAKAIQVADSNITSFSSNTIQGQFEILARAAIEAMREPTKEMLEAIDPFEPGIKQIYSDMIEAALKE